MKSIAIVTAPNMRFVNTGMTTVELAAQSVLGSLSPHANLKFFSIVTPNPSGNERWMMMDPGYVHRSAAGLNEMFSHRSMFDHFDEVLASDLIVYWGDFLHARHYIEHEAAGRLAALHNLSPSDAQAFAYNALLLSDASPGVKQKSLIFGSSLLYNRVSDYLSETYANSLRELVEASRLAAFRDPISGHRINHLTGRYETSYTGVDPAFLLRDVDLQKLKVSEWSMNLKHHENIGLFFGARTALPELLFPFCEAMASEFKCSLEWLPWFPFHEILRSRPKRNAKFFFRSNGQDLLPRIEKLLPRGDNYNQGDLLQAIRKYRFVITDTYHLSINAWRAGVPAICFGSESDSGNQVIKDLKKKVLYEMFDAGDFYFDTSSLTTDSGLQTIANRMARVLREESQVNAVRFRMETQASAARQRLVQAATQALA